jgi:cytochrome c-type biogenesis protein
VEIASVNVFAAFFFGMLSFLSPCVLPLLPGYLSMMSGYTAADLAKGNVSTARMLRVTLLFVAGFTMVFVLLGAGATSIGRRLLINQDALTRISGWFVVAFGAFIVLSAVWNPNWLMPFMRERRLDVRPSRLGIWAPPVMGAAFGFGWTPCIGPTLGSILGVATVQDTVAQGMFLLFIFGMGLGIPFVLFGIGINKMYGALAWMRRNLKPITVVSGVLLVAFGVLMVTGQLTELNRWFQRVFPWTPENLFDEI